MAKNSREPMSARQVQSDAVPRVISRYFDVALYLMVLSGFGTLAQTGQLDAITVLLVTAALSVRAYLLLRRKTFILPDRSTQYVTLAFTVFYLADFFWVSGSFVSATVHLVLALMVVRLFSAHRDRDYVFLAILSFLAVLAASVLTVNSAFLVMFAIFLLTAVATFILLEIRRSCASAISTGRELTPVDAQSMGNALAALSPVLMLFILVIAVGIFFLLPRMSGGYLSAYAAGGQLSAGFSDRVHLGQIGQIQQSNSVVMHIQVDGDNSGEHNLLWRGVALSIFDGANWWSPQKQIVVSRGLDGRFLLPQSVPPAGLRTRRQQRIHYRVLLEPIGANVFFLAPRPIAMQGNYSMLTTDDEGAVYDLDRDHPPSVYEADSDISRPTADQLRAAPDDFSTQDFQQYLELPSRLDGRIPALARQITSSAVTDYDKADEIERYLLSNYGYTLQLGRVTPKDPLAYFLFERKQGHCEYFASSMAVMLRTLDIPSRVVNGFRTGEFNDVTAQYVIRARNAHSWVEAYFPTYGWISFDPTPASAVEMRSGLGRTMLYLDAISSFWREWVVNYDFGHQRTLATEAVRDTRHVADAMRDWARAHYGRLLRSAREVRGSVMQSPRRWAGAAAVALALIVLLINGKWILSWLKKRSLAANPGKSPQLAATIWYERMTRTVARRGWRKSAAQTPHEFISTITDEELRGAVRDFTSAYESARFGDSAESARQLPRKYDEVCSRSDR
jgi:hypothetical protein